MIVELECPWKIAIAPPHRHRSRLNLLRTVVAHRRSGRSDLLLSMVLAFVAGATNAGGYLAIGEYTSHMTGIVSAVADNLALGLFGIAAIGVVAVVAFMLGAGCSAILINWARRNARTKQYAYPIALEATLLLSFGIFGALGRETPYFLSLAAPLLCFIMGLQNATITKISGARMRTTHLTGMLTDIGIELGKFAFGHGNRSKLDGHTVRADTGKIVILSKVVGMFLLGGIIGALGFGHLGYLFVIPLATLLLTLSGPRLIGASRAR